MWDTHFGVKLCRDRKPVLLSQGTVLNAAYTLSAESRAVVHPLFKRAQSLSAGTAMNTPVWMGGKHTFRETFRSENLDHNTAWPWQTVVLAGNANQVSFVRDTRVGCGDHYSLCIDNDATATACWQATTLGPAFGEAAFRSGGRLRLRAMVRSRGLKGEVRVLLRVHRAGRGSVFEVSAYEVHASEPVTVANQDWTELIITTPRLRPGPDRVHVLLQLEGRGSAWFDEVEMMRLP